jgi:hypothetical protein
MCVHLSLFRVAAGLITRATVCKIHSSRLILMRNQPQDLKDKDHFCDQCQTMKASGVEEINKMNYEIGILSVRTASVV